MVRNCQGRTWVGSQGDQMTDNDILTRDFTAQELAAQALFEVQLKFTADMINRLREDHPHYTDDCGDYLMAALELSDLLAVERAEGIEALVNFLDEKKKEPNNWLLDEY